MLRRRGVDLICTRKPKYSLVKAWDSWLGLGGNGKKEQLMLLLLLIDQNLSLNQLMQDAGIFEISKHSNRQSNSDLALPYPKDDYATSALKIDSLIGAREEE